MREKYVKEGYKVVADPRWSSDGEYNFYEIIEICGDMVTLGELACEVRARQIPGTTQWKIKFIRVREKVINYMDISKSNLMGEYDEFDYSKTYSLIVDNNPGYDDWTSDYDTDSDTDSDYHSDNDSDSGYDQVVYDLKPEDLKVGMIMSYDNRCDDRFKDVGIDFIIVYVANEYIVFDSIKNDERFVSIKSDACTQFKLHDSHGKISIEI